MTTNGDPTGGSKHQKDSSWIGDIRSVSETITETAKAVAVIISSVVTMWVSALIFSRALSVVGTMTMHCENSTESNCTRWRISQSLLELTNCILGPPTSPCGSHLDSLANHTHTTPADLILNTLEYILPAINLVLDYLVPAKDLAEFLGDFLLALGALMIAILEVYSALLLCVLDFYWTVLEEFIIRNELQSEMQLVSDWCYYIIGVVTEPWCK